jgi:hypothetical protein
VLASWSLAQGIGILRCSQNFLIINSSISWALIYSSWNKGAHGRGSFVWGRTLVVGEQFLSLLEAIHINASLGSHCKLQIIIMIMIIKCTLSIQVRSLFSIFSAFSCAPLLAYLSESLLFLLKGESARPGNLCKLIRDEMFLRLNSLLSLSKQMLEFHRRMWILISACHIGLFLNMIIVVRTSLYVLLDMSNSIRFIFSDIQLIIIPSFVGNFLSFPIASFKSLSLLWVGFSYSSIGNFISFSVRQIINPTQSSGFAQHRKSICLPSVASAFTSMGQELTTNHNSCFDVLSLADGNMLWTQGVLL